MAFQKGNQHGKGRKPGVPNKLTATAKEAFQLAFEELGGSAGLVEWAKGDPDNMGTFYSLYARMIPHDINAHVGRVRTEVILPVAPSE